MHKAVGAGLAALRPHARETPVKQGSEVAELDATAGENPSREVPPLPAMSRSKPTLLPVHQAKFPFPLKGIGLSGVNPATSIEMRYGANWSYFLFKCLTTVVSNLFIHNLTAQKVQLAVN